MIWKPEIQRIITTIHEDTAGWEELLNLYDPEQRLRKRDERYEQFEKLGLNNKWKINKDLFSHGWYGFDKMIINITTPGFKMKGVAVRENKLEYLEKLWLFSTSEADKKTQFSTSEADKKTQSEIDGDSIEVIKQNYQIARGRNNAVLTGSWLFLLVAMWAGWIPFLIIAVPLALIFWRITRLDEIDKREKVIEKQVSLIAPKRPPATRKALAKHATLVWLISAILLSIPLLTPGFCRTEAVYHENQEYFSRTTPSEWFSSGNLTKLESRTLIIRDESCKGDSMIGNILWSIENQPFIFSFRLLALLAFLFFVTVFVLTPSKNTKKKP